MQISVIIPTYNRSRDLKECLGSILDQTTLAKEVLIIDDSDRDKEQTRKTIEELKPHFSDKGISLEHIRNEKEKSLTVARNLGIECSSGDIISFLDDDLILDRKYYEEILKVYKAYPCALGVEGKVIEADRRKSRTFLLDFFGRLFYLGFREKNKCRMLPSLGVTYLSEDKTVVCEWISGASAYKREVFNEFSYDEKLKKYSWGEDQDLSYRIFKKYPNSLYIAPLARYFHKASSTGRMPNREIAYMEEIYSLYVFYKIVDQTLKNRLIYLWSRIGRLIFKIISALASKIKFAEIKYSIKACILCIKHFEQIKKGDLDFFNNTLA